MVRDSKYFENCNRIFTVKHDLVAICIVFDEMKSVGCGNVDSRNIGRTEYRYMHMITKKNK